MKLLKYFVPTLVFLFLASIAYAASVLTVPQGGTGAATFPTKSVIISNGTKATGTLQSVLGVAGQFLRASSTAASGFDFATVSGSLSGGTNGFAAIWNSATTLTIGILRDNGTVGGVNATSSTVSFNVQGSGTLDPFNVSSSSGTSILRVTAGGNVGIGTSTPSNPLTVVGTAQFSSLGTGVVHSSSVGLLSSSLIVNADITNSTIDLTTKVIGVLPIANGGTATSSAPSQIGQFLSYDGVATYGPTKFINGSNIIITTSTPGSLTIATTGLQPTISVTAPVTLTGASVGIVNQGTATQVLHGNASGNASFNAVALGNDVSGILPVVNGGTATTSLGNLTLTSSNLSFGSGDGKLILVGTSTNITLTTSPTFTNLTATNASTTNLTVANIFNLSGMANGCLQVTSGNATSTGSNCSSGGSGGLGTTSPFTAGFIPEATGTNVTLSNSNIFQKVDGNIGIGTTSPQKLFQVWGSQAGGVARITRDVGMVPLANSNYGTYDITAYSATSTIDWPQLTGPIETFSIATGTMQNIVGEIGGFRDNNDTTGGINIFSCLNGSCFSNIQANGSSTQSSVILFGTPGATSPVLTVSSSTGTSYLMVSNQGLVGVGTTTPSNALTVIGGISSSALTNTNIPIAGVGGLLGNSSLSQSAGTTFINGTTPLIDGAGDYLNNVLQTSGANFIVQTPTSTAELGNVVFGGGVQQYNQTTYLSATQFCTGGLFYASSSTAFTIFLPTMAQIGKGLAPSTCTNSIYAGNWSPQYLYNAGTAAVTSSASGTNETLMFAPGSGPITYPGNSSFAVGQFVASSTILGSTTTGMSLNAYLAGFQPTSTQPTTMGQILTADQTGHGWALTNLVAGSNVTITTSTLGQLTIASSGGGGGGVATITPFTNGVLPYASGTVPSLTDSPFMTNGIVNGINATVTGTTFLVKGRGTDTAFQVASSSAGSSFFRIGSTGQATFEPSFNVQVANSTIGFVSDPTFNNTSSTTPIANVYAFYNFPVINLLNATTTITNLAGYYNQTLMLQGKITNAYGLYIDAPSIGGGSITNTYSIVTAPSSGNVGISTTTPNFKFVNVGTAQFSGLATSSGSQPGGACFDSAGQLLNDTVTGGCVISSERYKTDWGNGDYGLNFFLKIPVRSYYYKSTWLGPLVNNPNWNGKQEGIFAEDVQKIAPELINTLTATSTFDGSLPGTPDSLKDFSHWIGPITKAFQDLSEQIKGVLARLDNQDKKIKTLQTQINNQQKEINTLQIEVNKLMK